jgi:hypothetical protein
LQERKEKENKEKDKFKMTDFEKSKNFIQKLLEPKDQILSNREDEVVNNLIFEIYFTSGRR